MATKNTESVKKTNHTRDAQTAGFKKPVQPSPELAQIVGSDPLPRTEVTQKVWAYIKTHHLQNPANRRNILADDTLYAVLGKKEVSMFELTKLISGHLRPI